MGEFNWQNFTKLLQELDIQIPELEKEEFFEEISEKLEEDTNIFEQMDEIEVLEKLVKILQYIPVDAFLDMHIPKIITLLECDENKLEMQCHKLVRGLVGSNDYYNKNEKSSFSEIIGLYDLDSY